MSAKSYVVLLSGTNVTSDGRTFTLNAGAVLPDDAENIEHLLDVKCIAPVSTESDLLMSAILTSQVIDPADAEKVAADPAEDEKPPAKGKASTSS